jgi:hypothetical protein
MRQERAEDSKEDFDAKHLESLAYTGFLDEETAILREYDGSKGKKVIRKVFHHLLHILQSLLFITPLD